MGFDNLNVKYLEKHIYFKSYRFYTVGTIGENMFYLCLSQKPLLVRFKIIKKSYQNRIYFVKANTMVKYFE